MAKSNKKSATKVDAAVIPAKPLKKATGKREAGDVVEKDAKKQQKEFVVEKKIEIKTKKKIVKKKSETSSDEESSSESEKELKVKVSSKNGALKSNSGSEDESSGLEEDVSVPKKTPAAKGSHVAAAVKKDESSDESDSEDETSSDENVAAPKKATAALTKNVPVSAAKKKDESSSDSEDETSSDEDVAASKKAPAALTRKSNVAAVKGKDESSSDDESSDEGDEAPKTAALKRTAIEAASKEKKIASSEDDSSDEESDDEEPQKKKIKAPPSKATKDESSSEEESSEEEEEDEKPSSKKKDTDVKMTDAVSTKANAGKGGSQIEKTPKTPITPKEQTKGSKTLFVGNLSYSVEQADVENFFKDAGEIVDVRFSMFPDNSFKGFGHVEFATAEEAEKALREMNGKELLGRPVKLDLARERGSYTPHSGEKDTQSFNKGGRAQGQTIFIRGFNKNDEEDQVRSALEDHFGSCGEISRVSLPKDQEGGFKGIAYIDFTDSEGCNKALELNGSEIGEYTLTVEEAKPRGDASGGARGGWGSGGRGSGDRFGSRFGGGGRSGGGGRFGGGGRSGGRFGDGGRSGGRFGDGGRGGRGGRGRGFPNKPNMAAAGKKTTFNNDE